MEIFKGDFFNYKHAIKTNPVTNQKLANITKIKILPKNLMCLNQSLNNN